MTSYSLQYNDKRHYFLASLLLLCMMMVCGCASNTIDDAVPVAIAEPPPLPQQTSDDPQAVVLLKSPDQAAAPPKTSGQYPNINVVPVGEVAQLSDVETARVRANLEGESQVQQQRGEGPDAYLARLKKLQKLGSTHAAATLRQIEKSQ
jgi:hypothetical protein